MDEITLQQLIHDHAGFPTALLNVFQGVPAEVLREREKDGRWSPLEILVHLRDEEIRDFRPRAQAAFEEREIEGVVDPERWAREEKYNEMDPGSVYLDFASERADSCRWLQTLRVEDLHRSTKHPKLGKMRAGDFISAWRMHDLLHLRQFATALAVIQARRYGDWRVDYAGAIPGAKRRKR